jgi:hypothetical protein
MTEENGRLACLPRQFSDLIAFLLFGFAADVEAVCEGVWFVDRH